jgi:hypothetical protein
LPERREALVGVQGPNVSQRRPNAEATTPMAPMYAGGVGRLGHAATVLVEVPAEIAFAYLADGMKQSEWALGSWSRERLDDGLFRGTSLFDGSQNYVRLEPDPESLLVDYWVGTDSSRMLRVNSARVVPGPAVGRPDGTSLVTLMKWRTPEQTDEDWERACLVFDTEVHMIKGRLELGF